MELTILAIMTAIYTICFLLEGLGCATKPPGVKGPREYELFGVEKEDE